MNIVSFLLLLVAVYLTLGLVFAVPFVIKGINKIDEGAHGSTWGFRILIIPGTIVFWPLLLRRWLRVLNK